MFERVCLCVCNYTRSMTIYFMFFVFFSSISLSSFHFIECQNPKCLCINNTQFQAHAKNLQVNFFLFRFRLLLLFLCVRISCVQFHGSINSNTRSRNGAILCREFALMRPKKKTCRTPRKYTINYFIYSKKKRIPFSCGIHLALWMAPNINMYTRFNESFVQYQIDKHNLPCRFQRPNSQKNNAHIINHFFFLTIKIIIDVYLQFW